ncbi:hypothetical protein WDU94_007273 [Cyamophila willieti]
MICKNLPSASLLILKSVYLLSHASHEQKLFTTVNFMAKAKSLPKLSELEFKNALNACLGKDFLDYVDFQSHTCRYMLPSNELCPSSCGCGGCGRYYRIKIGALNEFDVLDIMSIE